MVSMAVRARDAVGLYDSPPPIGDLNDGITVDWADFDPDLGEIISINVNGTLPTYMTSGAQSTVFPSRTWWGGNTGVLRLFPPTGQDAYAGFGSIPLWNNATKVIRQLNVRWEFLLSDLHLLGGLEQEYGTGLPKWILIDSSRLLSTAEDVLVDRAMLFLAHMNEADSPANRIIDALTAVPAMDTVRAFQSTNITPAPTFGTPGVTGYQNQRQQWQIRATAGTDGSGNPIYDNDEYMVVECRVNVMGTADEPNGVVAMRISPRSGPRFERATAWTNTPNDTGERPLINTNFISRIDVGGGGYYNLGNPHNANLYTDIGRKLTIGINYQPLVGRAWIGEPTNYRLV
jgi:hypothetical protein